MVENQCKARPVKAFIMSDLLTKFDSDATNDIVKVAVVVVFCLLYRKYYYYHYYYYIQRFNICIFVILFTLLF